MVKQLNFFDQDDASSTIKDIKSKNHWRLFVDGASRNNPGMSGAGIHLLKNNRTVKKVGFYLGIKTNNQAEYAALLIGIYYLMQYWQPTDAVEILSDSQLLVRQLNGEYKVRHPDLKPLHLLAKSLLHTIPCKITHVLREKNYIADEMANVGIDKKKPLPKKFLTLLKQHELQN